MHSKASVLFFIAYLLHQSNAVTNNTDAELSKELNLAATKAQPFVNWAHGHTQLLQEALGVEDQMLPNWLETAKLMAAGKATEEQKKKAAQEMMAFYFLGTLVITEMSDIVSPANTYLENIKTLANKLDSERI